jgi:hypothetical protein
MKINTFIKILISMMFFFEIKAVCQDVHLGIQSEMGAPYNGVALFVQVDKTTYTNQEPIVVKTILTNTTDSAVTVSYQSGVDPDIIMTSTNGISVPLIPIQRDRTITVKIASGPPAVALPAHEIIGWSKELHSIYDIAPGMYQVYARREIDLWKTNQTTSQSITIEIR